MGDAERIAEAILAEVGDQMGELYAALPELIQDHHEPYRNMTHDERAVFVQAVAEQIGGEGYEYGYPVP